MVIALLAVLGIDLIVIARVEVAAPADSANGHSGHSRPHDKRPDQDVDGEWRRAQ